MIPPSHPLQRRHRSVAVQWNSDAANISNAPMTRFYYFLSAMGYFRGGWAVLAYKQSSLKINVKLQSLITLKDSEGGYAITMSSDGKYLAGGSRLVEVFLAETGLRLWTLEIPSGDDEIHTAAFNKSATQLATAGEKGIIYVSILFSRVGLSSY